MIGVVLWSDASDRKAVIWCEDQGDLAFLNSADDVFQSDAFFDAGDVVQFDMEVQASMRRAHNPRLVLEQAGAGLPDALRQSASRDAHPRASAKIIPFEPREADVHVHYPQASEA
ncbi:MAG: hypothetical protein R8F89_18755 [Roseobacter sp.]|nr:hypothetical protein [Roseobacter sp.]